MLMVGLDSLESLDSCRLVCKTWNTMIKNKISIWENPTKEWGEIIQRRIQRSWRYLLPSDEKISQKISQAKMLGKNKIQP